MTNKSYSWASRYDFNPFNNIQHFPIKNNREPITVIRSSLPVMYYYGNYGKIKIKIPPFI